MSSELVSFKGGFVAAAEVVQRLWNLQERGATFRLIGDERFQVVPPAVLTPDDVAFLRQHRDEACALVEYVEAFDEM